MNYIYIYIYIIINFYFGGEGTAAPKGMPCASKGNAYVEKIC